MRLSYGPVNVYVDLGAERLIGAERGSERIAVEVKSFGGASVMHDFEEAVGQWGVYHSILKRTDPARRLYCAVPRTIAEDFLLEPIPTVVSKDLEMQYIVFDARAEEIVEWKT